MIVILNNIRSAHNVGSIFRTADALNVERIYLCGITPAPVDRFNSPNPKVIKVSLGSEKFVQWEKAKQAWRLINQLKSENYKIFAVEQNKQSILYHKVKLTKNDLRKVVLILGSETRGLSPSVLKRANKTLEIPMLGRKESLNVCIAFAIVGFSLTQSVIKK